MKRIVVRAADPRKAFWERHEAQPGHEVFVAGPDAFEVALTPAVQRALREGRIVETPKEAQMPQVFNYQGKRYTAENVHDAPVDFVLSLVEQGHLTPDGALAAERAGKGRVTLIAALEAMASTFEEEE